MIVSVNGRSWKIMRGVEVEVPLCAAEVLENARMMESTARSYVDPDGKLRRWLGWQTGRPDRCSVR